LIHYRDSRLTEEFREKRKHFIGFSNTSRAGTTQFRRLTTFFVTSGRARMTTIGRGDA